MLSSRLSTEGRGADTHLIVYSFIPDVLAQNPLFGLGLNTFSVYYEFQTGKTNFGPHSFYVASFVEYGLVGTLVFAAFLVYLFRRAALTRRIGRELAAAGDPLAARIRPLGWGLTAAIVSTMVSNIFYLTMSFYYFYVLALLAIAAPAALAHHLDDAAVRVVGPHDVVSAECGRRRRDLRARRRRGPPCHRARGACRLARRLPALRHRLRGRDREQPPRRAVEAPRAAALPPRVRARRAQGLPRLPTSCTRTGCPRRSRRSPPGSRSCSSSGAPTSASRGGCGPSRVSSSAAPESWSAPRRRSPRTHVRSGRATSA